MRPHDTTEVWAQLVLREADALRIQDFFLNQIGIKRRCILRGMHITVYHCRRPMPNLEATCEPASVIIPAQDMRFMVMAPGGENPHPSLEPAMRKIGVRVHKSSKATSQIREYRNRLIIHETPKVLGSRARSTNFKNAFGARHFQPHMSVLYAGNGVDRDLTIIGDKFRDSIGDLVFDEFVIDIVRKAADGTIERAPKTISPHAPTSPLE